MFEAILLALLIIGSVLIYRWLRAQRQPWKSFALSIGVLFGALALAGELFAVGHGNVIGWQPGLYVAVSVAIVVLMIWASHGGAWR